MKLSDARALITQNVSSIKRTQSVRWCVKSVIVVFSSYVMKILATTGEMQDPIEALKPCQYKELLIENTVKLNTTPNKA